jgi:general secretion pathway protein C
MYYFDLLKKYLWVVKLVAVALAAFLSANAVSISIRGKLTSMPKVDLEQKVAGSSAYVPLSDYEIIIKRSLFNSAAVNMQASFNKQEALGPLTPAADYELLGTMAGPPTASLAIIKNRASNVAGVYGVGDWVAENVTRVVDIRRQRVTLLHNGEEQQLAMAGAPSEALALGNRWNRGAGENVAEGIKRLNEGDFVIDKSVVNEAFENMGNLMRGARIVPEMERGKIVGFKMLKIRKKSLYDQIGLQDGDVIHRINSVEFRGPEDALRMFMELRNAGNISIDITRGGQRQTLNYQVR